MVFKRTWDSSCPLLWDKWEADGIIWTIEDLPPEEDEHAIKLLLEEFCPDETLVSTLGISEDPHSLQKMGNFWRECISHRMSLACYKTVNYHKELVAFNVCIVKSVDDEEHKMEQMQNDKFNELLSTLTYLESKYDAFKDLGVDKFLYGLGLLVTRENRGFKLGARVLAARSLNAAKAKYVSENQKEWSSYLTRVVFSYNISSQASTRVSLYNIVFGRDSSLKMDIILDNISTENDQHTLKDKIHHIQDLTKITAKRIVKAQEQQKKQYDKKAKL